jgi:hypothetical protein
MTGDEGPLVGPDQKRVPGFARHPLPSGALAPERSATVELRSWYLERLRPQLTRAARLGLVDRRRAIMLDRDLRVLIGHPSPAGSENDR